MMFDTLLPAVYTISEVTTVIRQLIESAEPLQAVRVQGEVSNMKRYSSGHWYFTLKDGGAQLKCVMWRSNADKQRYKPEDGDQVEARGSIGVYDAQGVYQLYAESLKPVGMGDLYRQFEELKARLDAEGLFDPARKRPLPAFPRQIGVVTSPQAAAFQDIQNVLRRRFPLAEIILSPTPVQGADAPPQIAAALERLNQYTQVDVILLIRGGGSIEDLWAFNDEGVARAVAASRIPVVTGVGHEIDFTMVDFVADQRAPTPSAAAEIATPNLDDLRYNTRALTTALDSLMLARLADLEGQVSVTSRTLGHLSPVGRIRTLRQRVDDLTERAGTAQSALLRLHRERLTGQARALEAANPAAILKRGYAIVRRSSDNTPVTRAADTAPDTALTIQFHDGEIKVRTD
ncbi:MAG: exodeoxyribonuclease VII large subunit [Anaerolineae bacterium]|nr:exodeoxyribonuclease VII large subunit [Anaerolineae bacterium]